MPGYCNCKICERFRENLPPSRLTVEARKALEKANTPKKKSNG